MPPMKGVQDVVIIGGGPGGSTAASLLAMQGHQVTLLEKEKFPREHVGESLLPFCYSLFERLGVVEELKKRFVRKPGVRFVDPGGKHATSWCFAHVIHDDTYLSFQVTRGEFDQLLLENSRRHGATVREETRVRAVDLEGPDGTVLVTAMGPDGSEQQVQARFLLDASGRSAFMASEHGWRQHYEGLDRTAFWTHCAEVNMIGGLEEGLSLIVYLGGDKKGWIWVFPLDTDRLTVGVVLNNEHIRQQKTALQEEGVEDWRLELFWRELALSSFVSQILEGSRVTSPLKVEGDYSYYVDQERKYGRNFALVGDSATFIDPIFSSGVFLAMNSSRLVTEAIHQQLTDGKTGDAEPMAAAYEKINGAYSVIHRLIRLFYTPHAISFAEAGALIGPEHQQHQDAMAAGHFLLAGDFFERHEEFNEFMDLLYDERMFRNYKHVVIDRKEYQATTCGAAEEEIFPGAAAAAD